MTTEVDARNGRPFEPFCRWQRRGMADEESVQHDSFVNEAALGSGLYRVTGGFGNDSKMGLLPPNGHAKTDAPGRSCPSPPSSMLRVFLPTPNRPVITSRSPGTPGNSAANQTGRESLAPANPSDSGLGLRAAIGQPPAEPSPRSPATSPSIPSSEPGSCLGSEPQAPKPSLKRRRALSDVDGPNTAALCCKKRRLRRFLITSRLSRPFSQPATHILNRESVASGDTRFLKLAAIMNSKRIIRLPTILPMMCHFQQSKKVHEDHNSTTEDNEDDNNGHNESLAPSDSGKDHHQAPLLVPVAHLPCPSDMLRRAAMAHRFRERIFSEVLSGKWIGRPLVGIPVQLMSNARIALVTAATAASMSEVQSAMGAMHSPEPAATTAAFSGLTVGDNSTNPPTAKQPPLPRSPATGNTTVGRQLIARMIGHTRGTTPGSRPRPGRSPSHSPKSRPMRDRTQIPDGQLLAEGSPKATADDSSPAGGENNESVRATSRTADDDDDDTDCAFPTSEHESSYEVNDDPEDVYSDFSVLFSGTGDNNDWNDEGLDGYMDEMDGIAHVPW